jgi:hypothetical protein
MLRHRLTPRRSPKRYALSEQYIHLVESPEQFRPVLAERLARLVSLFQRCRCSKAEHVQQNTLPQLSLEGLKQAKADIVYLKSILDDEGMNIAQVRAGAVYSART